MHIELPTVLMLLGTIFFVSISRHAIVDPRCHGFYRFFAFEATLALVAIESRFWFSRKWSLPEVVSLLLLGGSAVLALHGYRILVRKGRPNGDGADARTFTFENTTVLVTGGAYRFIRHPMYSALLLLAWAMAIKDPTALRLTLAGLVSALIVAAAVVEEGENLSRFGSAYRAYMLRTRRFVPFLF